MAFWSFQSRAPCRRPRLSSPTREAGASCLPSSPTSSLRASCSARNFPRSPKLSQFLVSMALCLLFSSLCVALSTGVAITCLMMITYLSLKRRSSDDGDGYRRTGPQLCFAQMQAFGRPFFLLLFSCTLPTLLTHPFDPLQSTRCADCCPGSSSSPSSERPPPSRSTRINIAPSLA